MAIQNHGPLSRAKGKLGGVVYQQYEGMQVSREYQPVVKNPQTSKQTNNRAKFKQASQVTAMFNEVINVRFAPLSIYKRNRRGAAVNAIHAVIEPRNEGSFSSTIDGIAAALNAKNMSPISAPTITADTSERQFSIVAQSGDVVTFVVNEFDADGAITKHTVETYTSDGTAKLSDVVEGTTAICMVVVTRATTEAGRAIISNVRDSSGEFVTDISRGVASGDLLVSNLGVEILS